MQTLQKLYLDSGFTVDGINNRQRAVRSLNSVFKNSGITMSICDKGMIWTGSDGFKYNVAIALPDNGKVHKTRFKTKDFTPYSLLKMMGQFLRREEVKKVITSETAIPHTCGKCEGSGFIPQFAYYAEGVCFDCMGAGIIGKLMVQNVKKLSEATGRNYINQFYARGNYAELFPKGVENIKPVSFIGHPTAEQWLSKKEDVYYLHQPVCMSNTWFAIPEASFEKFKKEFNKCMNYSI